MKVKCINDKSSNLKLKLGGIYEVVSETANSYLVKGGEYWNKSRFEVIEQPTQIIDFNGIQTEPFTHEEKKVIAVEKDIAKCEIWNTLLNQFKTANDLQRIALLEIFEEMGYPKTDMVKLYRVIADES